MVQTKELVGNYANGTPDPGVPEGIRYGVPEVGANRAGSTSATMTPPAFAVASIARRWERMGAARYPDATRLMITPDAGGSNSYRSRAWKIELAKLAASLGVVVTLWHTLLGTSQWNKIEHRLFGFMSMNWPGKPVTIHRVIVELIVTTTTQTGLGVEVDLGYGHCPLKQKVTNAELAAVPFTGHNWHPGEVGDWLGVG